MQRASELSADALWGEISARLRDALNDATYTTWFAEAGMGPLDDDAFVVLVPNDFTREWIEGHFRGLLEEIVRDTLGAERPVRIDVSASSSRTPRRPHPAAAGPLARGPRTRSTRSTRS